MRIFLLLTGLHANQEPLDLRKIPCCQHRYKDSMDRNNDLDMKRFSHLLILTKSQFSDQSYKFQSDRVGSLIPFLSSMVIENQLCTSISSIYTVLKPRKNGQPCSQTSI